MLRRRVTSLMRTGVGATTRIASRADDPHSNTVKPLLVRGKKKWTPFGNEHSRRKKTRGRNQESVRYLEVPLYYKGSLSIYKYFFLTTPPRMVYREQWTSLGNEHKKNNKRGPPPSYRRSVRYVEVPLYKGSLSIYIILTTPPRLF